MRAPRGRVSSDLIAPGGPTAITVNRAQYQARAHARTQNFDHNHTNRTQISLRNLHGMIYRISSFLISVVLLVSIGQFETLHAQNGSSQAEASDECLDCITEMDFLMALVQWRTELVEKHGPALSRNELFSTTVEYLKTSPEDTVKRDSIIRILDLYLYGSPIKYERAIMENVILRDPDYFIDRAERKDTSSKSLHETLRLRGTLHAFQDVGPLAMDRIVEPEWPLKLSLDESLIHQELGKYRLKRGEVVADIGTGMGIIPRILGRVGVEHTYANEIGAIGLGLPVGYPNYHKRMKESLADSLAQRLEVVKGTKKKTNHPEASCDVILIRNTYHHFTNPEEMISSIKTSLAPKGRVLVVDHYLDFKLEKVDELPLDLYCEKSQPFQTHIDAFTTLGFKMIRKEDLPRAGVLTEWVLVE